jgi:drug/metabolite transporter (DMT)-like permease
MGSPTVLDTVLLALAASLCWGTADFTAGLKARTVPLANVLLFAQGIGLALALVVVVAGGRPFPSAGPALASLGAGAAVIAGLACFYRALAAGTMSVVAPVAATGVAIPVLAGVLGGNHLAAAQVAGMAIAVLGVALAARHPAAGGTAAARRRHRDSIVLAVIAAVTFGCYFLLAHIGTRGGVAWLLTLANVSGVLGVLAVAAARRSPLRPPPPADIRVLAAAGVLEFAATGLYGLANRHGQLSIVAVAGSLYPVATVLLARVVAKERLARLQSIGVGLALVGVALIAT